MFAFIFTGYVIGIFSKIAWSQPLKIFYVNFEFMYLISYSNFLIYSAISIIRSPVIRTIYYPNRDLFGSNTLSSEL